MCIYQEVDGKPKLDNFTLEDIEGNCDSKQFDPSTSVLNRCEYLHFYRWKRALNASNRIWR